MKKMSEYSGPIVKAYMEDSLKSIEALTYHLRLRKEFVEEYLRGNYRDVDLLREVVEACPKWVPYIPGRGIVGVD